MDGTAPHQSAGRPSHAAVVHTATPHPGSGLREASLMRRLARAAVLINSPLSVEEILAEINHAAAELIGAHQATTYMAVEPSGPLASVYLSDKYADWRGYDPCPQGSDIHATVRRENSPLRLTHAELLAHPTWQVYAATTGPHPPLRGLLAVPLTSRQGENLGVIQLSDKVEGEFTETDEDVLVQLAHLASVAVEKARLYELSAAQEAGRLREELMAGVSHDMQTPLAALVGFADLLLAEPDLPVAERQQIYRVVARQTRTLRGLVQQFLDFLRLEADRRLVIHPAPTDVVAVIERVASMFDHHRDIIVGASRNLPTALADPERLEQVVANLVSNAVKFSDDPIRVVARPDPAGDVMIDVVDEGRGMEADELEAAFEKFHRGPNADGTSGSGLGLYISRAVVEAQGGTLTASSLPGSGSRFRVVLPAARGV